MRHTANKRNVSQIRNNTGRSAAKYSNGDGRKRSSSERSKSTNILYTNKRNIDRRSGAVRSGFVKFTKGGNVDGRSAASRQGLLAGNGSSTYNKNTSSTSFGRSTSTFGYPSMNYSNFGFTNSGSVMSASSNTNNGILYKTDGTIDRRCKAVINGDVLFKNDGTVDKRCKAYKQGWLTDGNISSKYNENANSSSSSSIERSYFAFDHPNSNNSDFDNSIRLKKEGSPYNLFSAYKSGIPFKNNSGTFSSRCSSVEQGKSRNPTFTFGMVKSSNNELDQRDYQRMNPENPEHPEESINFQILSQEEEEERNIGLFDQEEDEEEKRKMLLKQEEEEKEERKMSIHMQKEERRRRRRELNQKKKNEERIRRGLVQQQSEEQECKQFNQQEQMEKERIQFIQQQKEQEEKRKILEKQIEEEEQRLLSYRQQQEERRQLIQQKEAERQKLHQKRRKNEFYVSEKEINPEFKMNSNLIYMIALSSLVILYFVVLSFIPNKSERNYLQKCPKHAHCDNKIEGNKTIVTINHCDNNFDKLVNGFIQICSPKTQPKLSEYSETLNAAAFISKVNGNCMFNENSKISLFKLNELFPKSDADLLQNDEDFLTEFVNGEFKSLVPQYNLMCRVYKNSFEDKPLQTILVMFVLIVAIIYSSINFLNEN